MSLFKNPLLQLADYELIKKHIKESCGSLQICGLADTAKSYFISEILKDERPWRLVVSYDENRAERIYEDISSFNQCTFLYPAKDMLFFDADIRNHLITKGRIDVWKHMVLDEEGIVVTTVDALMDKLIGYEYFKDEVIKLKDADIVNLDSLCKKLAVFGYERNSEIEGAGQFAVRGGIIDIFPLTEDMPVRLELWGDEIDSIRSFDIETQRSIENISEVDIYPAKELHTDGKMSFLEYWNLEKSLIFIDEPHRVIEKAEFIENEFKEGMAGRIEAGQIEANRVPEIFSSAAVMNLLKSASPVCLTILDNRLSFMNIKAVYSIESRQIPAYHNSFELLIEDLKKFKYEKYRVVLMTASRTRAARLAQSLTEYGLSAFYMENAMETDIQPGHIMVVYGNIHSGFEYPNIKFIVISESDIFGKKARKNRIKKSKKSKTALSSLNELNPGDYVVHEDYGIGIYHGIEKVELDGAIKDYIKIEYAGDANVMIPVSRLDIIQKYADAQAKHPRINKIGGREWVKTKGKVKTAVEAMAKDLVELYAARLKGKGFTYSPDTVWQREFEEMFPFEETEDQIKAIEDAKHDMESGRIMDRLVCGDVGYGKTEVALRVAFKAVQESRQVIYLVPTTILAKQHYNTFKERMKDFPVRIDLMCRFISASQKKKTINEFNKGLVDIVIGTHSVLSKSLQPKALGVVVIDEEQRFGVRHKEKLKKLRENVDVLTLTATPIPRTLHMSLAGIRDLNMLSEPPLDRKPIQTYVMEYHDEIVKEAVKREIMRGGQVYFVYNRIDGIQEVADRIKQLLPDINTAYAHGRMEERQLENIMLDFISGDIDVLVSTTIIETGIDIPNVNTIIIYDADKMGLSQLYQLRGRVGRSSRTAYAFMMYRRDKLLTQEAEKRLKAIKEFTELGSGIKIAMRDLEIRGAGNVLGKDQHGHMEAVGYELYCKLLNTAVNVLKGDTYTQNAPKTVVELEADAYIPYEYIKDEEQKLDIYKRISLIETEEDLFDMQDELIDRFGEIPHSVLNLLKSAVIKSEASKLYIGEVDIKRDFIQLTMHTDEACDDIDTGCIQSIVDKYKGRLRINIGEKTIWKLYPVHKNSLAEADIDGCMELLKGMQILKKA